MWGFMILACLCQGIYSSEEFKTSEKPVDAHTVDPECFMNVSEIIYYHGYPSEEHCVETEDGYVLTIYRIPHGKYNNTNKGPRPVALLQHSLAGDATHWISNTPSNSLGFILADAGFHEMGYYDLPAVIYFILNKTGQEQLYYIGHSEGTSSGFIAFSIWPKLAARIKVFFALAPVATVTFSTTPVTKLSHLPKMIIHAIFGEKEIFQNSELWRKSRMDMYVAHSPAGTSVQNMFHWEQLYFGTRFKGYDYGSEEKNMEKYNQTTPPVYKIEDIQIPIAIWSGGHDLFADPDDVKILRPRISNLIYEKHIPEWNHLDFIWGVDATERMFMEIIEIMKKYP